MWTLVTGGNSPLGAVICMTLAAQGHNLAIHYRNHRARAEDIAEECRRVGGRAAIIRGDFSSPDLLQEFIHEYRTHFDRTGVLINNAAVYEAAGWNSTPYDSWSYMFQVNFHTPMTLIQTLQPKSAIVNIGVAGLGRYAANTYNGPFALTKEALWLATRGLAKELAPSEVRVNMVSPGHLENSIDLHAFAAKLPMCRPGKLQEVADVVAFLLSDESQYITGQNIEVAGGALL